MFPHYCTTKACEPQWKASKSGFGPHVCLTLPALCCACVLTQRFHVADSRVAVRAGGGRGTRGLSPCRSVLFRGRGHA